MNAHQRRIYIRKHAELVTSTIALMTLCDQPRRAQRVNERWARPDSLGRILAVDACKRFRASPPDLDIPVWGDLMWGESVKRKWAQQLHAMATRSESKLKALAVAYGATSRHDDFIDTASTLTTGLQGKKVISVIHDEITFLPP